jgi:hypothetical protein
VVHILFESYLNVIYNGGFHGHVVTQTLVSKFAYKGEGHLLTHILVL